MGLRFHKLSDFNAVRSFVAPLNVGSPLYHVKKFITSCLDHDFSILILTSLVWSEKCKWPGHLWWTILQWHSTASSVYCSGLWRDHIYQLQATIHKSLLWPCFLVLSYKIKCEDSSVQWGAMILHLHKQMISICVILTFSLCSGMAQFDTTQL